MNNDKEIAQRDYTKRLHKEITQRDCTKRESKIREMLVARAKWYGRYREKNKEATVGRFANLDMF